MMQRSISNFWFVWIAVFFTGQPSVCNAQVQLETGSQELLSIPALTKGEPAAGKRVAVTAPEYSGTQVCHTVYLPADWRRIEEPNRKLLPIIFEYTGNFFPASGSTGEPEDAHLGHGLSGGKYIWVSMPYVSEDLRDNAVTWWGDEAATVEYAKINVPRIIEQFGADPDAVLLCGFSRGAIAVNYIGLYDDEVAKLWTAFISHDHFDGMKEWRGKSWGSPLDQYRTEALKRLNRVGNRPYFVSQNGNTRNLEDYIRGCLVESNNFTFNQVDVGEIFRDLPNEYAKTGHTDRWLVKPSSYRTTAWKWMNETVSHQSRNSKALSSESGKHP